MGDAMENIFIQEVYAPSVNVRMRLKSEHFIKDQKTFTLLFY